jgi:hypothetical protein
MYIRQIELEKWVELAPFKEINLPGDRLERLKQKIKEQRKHMDELDKHIDEYTKSQGGEQN